MSLEKAITITAKFYEARDAAMLLYGDEYQSEVEDYKGFIQKQMLRSDKGPMEATLWLLKFLKSHGDEGGGMCLLLAACVELVEGPKKV